MGPLTIWAVKVVAGAKKRVHYETASSRAGAGGSLSIGKETVVANADEGA